MNKWVKVLFFFLFLGLFTSLIGCVVGMVTTSVASSQILAGVVVVSGMGVTCISAMGLIIAALRDL